MREHGPLREDEPAARDAQRRLQERRARADDDLRAVMSAASGRRFVWRLVDEVCGVSSASFCGDPHATAFHEGERSVGILLMREAQAVAPADWVSMLAEAMAARRVEQDARTSSTGTETLEE